METGTLLHSMSESLSLLDTQLQKLSSSGAVSLERVRAEVDQLSANVAEKYSAAEQAAEKFAPPAKTAQLFHSAQNEAKLLEQDAKQLGVFSSTQKRVADLQKQASVQREQVRKVEDAVQQLLSKQSAALNHLQGGLADNVQYCRYVSAAGSCAQQGKKGVAQAQEAAKQLTQLQEQFLSSVLQKEMRAEVQALASLQTEVRSLSEQMAGRVQEIARWENDNMLSLRAGKSVFAAFRSDFDGISAQFVKRNQGFAKEFAALLRTEGLEDSSSNKKAKKDAGAHRREADKELALQSLLKALEVAQQKGIAAEKITVQAKARGLAEAQVFMKNSKNSGAKTASSPAKANAADSRTTTNANTNANSNANNNKQKTISATSTATSTSGSSAQPSTSTSTSTSSSSASTAASK